MPKRRLESDRQLGLGVHLIRSGTPLPRNTPDGTQQQSLQHSNNSPAIYVLTGRRMKHGAYRATSSVEVRTAKRCSVHLGKNGILVVLLYEAPRRIGSDFSSDLGDFRVSRRLGDTRRRFREGVL